MTFYKGSVINFFWTGHGRHTNTPPTAAAAAAAANPHNDGKFIKGSILLIIATLAWAAFFILQAITMRKYTAHLSLTTMVCFLGTLQAIVVTLAMDHPRHSWSIGWDMNLLAAAYGVRKTKNVSVIHHFVTTQIHNIVDIILFGLSLSGLPSRFKTRLPGGNPYKGDLFSSVGHHNPPPFRAQRLSGHSFLPPIDVGPPPNPPLFGVQRSYWHTALCLPPTGNSEKAGTSSGDWL